MKKTGIGKQIRKDERYRIIFFTVCGLAINLIYAFFNGILGIMSQSVWLINLCVYYVILSMMRLGAVIAERRNAEKSGTAAFIMRFCGIALIVLAFVLTGTVCLSLKDYTAVKHQETVMIAIASYTFYKITLSVVNAVKVKKYKSPLLGVIRGIGCADAAVSVFSLQQSMIVSFGEDEGMYNIMGAALGAAVFVFIVFLGIGMILKSRE